MIFITGDTHGEFNRLSSGNFKEGNDLTKNDYVIICGDFGGVWDGSRSEQYWLGWLSDKPFTLLFIDGNHENYDMLSTYPITEWRGGKVRHVSETIIHLLRGQVYEIDGKRIFTMGGARSHDIEDGILEPDAPDFLTKKRGLNRRSGRYRINHETWWKEEIPSDSEYNEAAESLNNSNWNVDTIITHCAPSSLLPILARNGSADALTDFLESIKCRCTYNKWFFGHYHQDCVIDEKHSALYQQVVKI